MLRFAVALLVVLSACGTSSRRAFDADDSDAGKEVPPDPTSDFAAKDAGTDMSTDDGCSDAARLVYVVSYEDRGLYSFKPSELAFKRIGTLDCVPGSDVLPRSMAVDRQGTAWVNHTDGRIYKVSTTDASCVDSGYEAPDDSWRLVNMGFASDTPGGKAETLYVMNAKTDGVQGLAKIDPATLKVTLIGQFSGELEGAIGELTGTGTSRLFGFFKTMGEMTFSELDPKSATSIGANVKIHDTLVTTTMAPAYAFSFWGGDFWFYVADDNNRPSKVIQYKASSDGSQSLVMADVGGFQIVGAGVSTCAPTTPIR